ncbi:DUF3025 domain-containing protein [Rhodanobacter fulvus]|uniref:DUF3025 domain-containing protein n=1 Tax=Rhodanobacter fulvus TaxID=219571 RepID=UPI002351E563|nr:DUF3025 domain-containing protein [Rhodanobacter fulvus]
MAPIGALETCAQAIAGGHVLHDPLELRPSPQVGVPGWHPDNEREVFYREAPCFCPARPADVTPRRWRHKPRACADRALLTIPGRRLLNGRQAVICGPLVSCPSVVKRCVAFRATHTQRNE